MNTKEVSFNSSGLKIKGTLVFPEEMQEKKPGVIFFHGMTSSETGYIPIAEELAKHGIIGMTLSIRGHGKSEGDFNLLTLHDGIQDGLAAYSFLSQLPGIDVGLIGLCGSSVGAAIAVSVASEERVRSLVLRVPAVYDKKMMDMTYQELMNQEGSIFQNLQLADNPQMLVVSQFTGDLLVISSERDAAIPARIPEGLIDSAKKSSKKKYIVLRDATHELKNPEWRKQFISETVDWFVETL